MYLKVAFTVFVLFSGINAVAQLYDPTPRPTPLDNNAYRSKDNKYYWRNRMPDAAYWQQDVQYKIAAKMIEDDNRIDATEELTYWNNSPDTLTYVYFHLYQNAFIKGSYLHGLEAANNTPPPHGQKGSRGTGHSGG